MSDAPQTYKIGDMVIPQWADPHHDQVFEVVDALYGRILLSLAMNPRYQEMKHALGRTLDRTVDASEIKPMHEMVMLARIARGEKLVLRAAYLQEGWPHPKAHKAHELLARPLE